MLKRFSVIVAALLLASVGAAQPTEAQYHACSPFAPGGNTGNVQDNGSSGSVYGAKAVINPTLATFRLCTDTLQTDFPDSISGWIAITPASGNPQFGSLDAILQVGVTQCNIEAEYPVLCEPGQLVFFWAYGGCPTNAPKHPTGTWINDTNDNQHTYEIHHVSSGGSRYSLYIDGLYMSITVPVSDPAVDCWLGDRHGAKYGTETWNAGDGIADAGAPVIFSSIGWRLTDSGAWQTPTWSGTAPCDQHDTTAYLDLGCDISNIDNTQFYSWSTLH